MVLANARSSFELATGAVYAIGIESGQLDRRLNTILGHVPSPRTLDRDTLHRSCDLVPDVVARG